MASVERSVVINAPVETVFQYVDNPNNAPLYWKQVSNIHDVVPNPKGGKNFGFSYNMNGIKIEGHTEIAEYAANRKIVLKSRTGIDSVMTWQFEPEGDGTRVTLNIEYKVPVPVLGKLAEGVIARQNESDADALMNSLKGQIEG